MADGKHDFLIEYIGGLPSSVIDVFNVQGILDLQLDKYLRLPRKLERRSRGTNDNPGAGQFLQANLTTSIVNEINKFQKEGKTIGQVLITGFSKGAIYAFKLGTDASSSSPRGERIFLVVIPDGGQRGPR